MDSNTPKKRMYANKYWNSIDHVKEAFNRFHRENGHFPLAFEIDKCDYFPSSKQLERIYGGITGLRKQLGMEVSNYGEGKNRSELAYKVNKRGLEYEGKLGEELNFLFR